MNPLRRFNFNPLLCCIFSSATLLLSTHATAQTLPELWERVQRNDPTLVAARAQLRAVLERENQAFAQFLPQVNFSANTTHNHREYQQTGLFPSISKEFYNSHGSQINITQPIWKKSNSANHQQAQFSSEQARFQYQASEQEALGKLVSSWAELLYAKSAWLAANTLEAAAREQLLNFERGFDRGLYSMGQRDEARAKSKQASADRSAAESDVFAKQIALEQLTGPLPTFAARLGGTAVEKLPFGELRPFDAYADEISNSNPAVKAARMAWEASRQEVEKISAQRWGAVELVASIGRTAQPKTGATPSQSGFKSQLDTIGVQYNVPLYTGGGQTAKEREAVALAEKAQADLDALILSTRAQAGQAWAQARASHAKAAAAEQAVIAADTALATARLGQRAGTKTPADELQASQQRENARKELYRAYYDNIIGMVKLQGFVGHLDAMLLADLQMRHQQPVENASTPELPLRLKMTLSLQ